MKNKKEKQIVAITAIATIVLVSSFTIMQGTIKNKEDKYISRDTQTQLDIEISKDSYEIIKNESLNKENEYVVLQKKKLSSQELALLTNEITKENHEKFKVYIFQTKEDAMNFDGSEDKIEKIVTKNGNDTQIQTYNLIENEVESIPKNYKIKSVKSNESSTKIELEIESIDKPEEALANIKFLGQSIKDLNNDEVLEALEIQAYHKDNKNISWNYSSENKSRIIKNEIVDM